MVAAAAVDMAVVWTGTPRRGGGGGGGCGGGGGRSLGMAMGMKHTGGGGPGGGGGGGGGGGRCRRAKDMVMAKARQRGEGGGGGGGMGSYRRAVPALVYSVSPHLWQCCITHLSMPAPLLLMTTHFPHSWVLYPPLFSSFLAMHCKVIISNLIHLLYLPVLLSTSVLIKYLQKNKVVS